MRPDQQAGFWNEYVPPESHVAALAQQPCDNINVDAFFAAYQRDCRAKRGVAKETS